MLELKLTVQLDKILRFEPEKGTKDSISGFCLKYSWSINKSGSFHFEWVIYA
jgi:hypothetical protein